MNELWQVNQQYSGWGRATASRSATARARDNGEWEKVLASVGPRGLIPRGAGNGYGDAAQNAGGVVAETTTAAAIGDLDRTAGTVTVDAGATLADLMRVLVPAGWTLPVLPGTTRVTVGGAIAADVHGKNHPAAGSFGAHVAEMTLLTPATGPHTLRPDCDGPLFWATVGGLGLTGVIRRARLRLRPLATSWMFCEERVGADLSAVLSALACASAQGAYAAAWIDGRRRGRHLGAGVVSSAREVAMEELPTRWRSRALVHRPLRPVPIPRLAGPGVIAPRALALANRLHLAAAARRRPRRLPLAAALHPLDAIPGAPRLYGRRGLIQYQFVVPAGAEDVLAEALALPQAAGCPTTLAVLKTFGAADPAPLSFPRPGWNLALDFPAAAPRLAGLLDRLDERVAAAGGRINLVKDSRLRPDLVEAMYPQLPAWRAVRATVDPHGVMNSDLARRLRLIGDPEARP